jgi:hypothetical protein
MNGSTIRCFVGATARWSGKLEREDGSALPINNISAATCSLRDGASGTYIRGTSGSPQNILGTGAGSNGFTFASNVDGTTDIGWNIALSDVALISPLRTSEEHVADITITYNLSGVSKVLLHTIRLRCIDSPGLCTYEDVLLQIGDPDDGVQTPQLLIEQMIDAFSEVFEKQTLRRVRKSTEQNPTIEVLSAPYRYCRLVSVTRYPIDSVISVKENVDGVFTEVDAIDNDEFMVHANSGQLEMRWRSFYYGIGCIEVTYAGGMYSDTGAVPADVRWAAARQVGYWWKRRDQMGLQSASVPGSSISIYTSAPLLPEVTEIVRLNRRPRHW